jgi:uncharacterized membrane protein YozB (DUF420 family)
VGITDLPLVNACLNVLSTLFLLVGFRFIKAGNRQLHKRFMLSALVTSGLFLVSYAIYHYNVGSVKFTGVGASRTIYFSILISHTLLAIILPSLVGVTLYRALKEKFDRHKVIARITLPIWLYVSITGVAVYLMLYQFFAAS